MNAPLSSCKRPLNAFSGFDKQEALRILRTPLRKYFKFQKAVDAWTEAGHTILKEKLLLEVKLTEGKQRS